MTIDSKGIATKAMLVRFSVTSWTAKKFDRKASDKTAEVMHADKDSGRYNKHLLAGAKLHADIIKSAGAARDVHYTNTLPWTDEGSRLLPTANYQKYTDAMRTARRSWDDCVGVFVDEYPQLQVEAEKKLGPMYRAEEYPPAREIKRRFTWDIEVMPLPADGDLRLDLPDDVRKLIEVDVTCRVQRATDAAMRDAWQRLHASVARIKMRTGDEESPLRGTLIAQARELVDVLGRLNVTNDAALDAMRNRVLRDLAVYDVELLRNDPDLRADTAKKAAAIMSAMECLFKPMQEVA